MKGIKISYTQFLYIYSCAGFREDEANFLQMMLQFGFDQNSAETTGMF